MEAALSALLGLAILAGLAWMAYKLLRRVPWRAGGGWALTQVSGARARKREYKAAQASFVQQQALGAPEVCTKVYRTAGDFKRGVEKMAREGWTVQSQSSATPSRVGLGASTGWTKTLVVFTRERR